MPHPRVFLAFAAAVLSFAAHTRAGTAPAEFVGIPWKASLAEAKRVMAQRKDVHLTQESPDRLVLEGGTFAEQPVEHWELDFPEGKFSGATVHLSIPSKKEKGADKIRSDASEHLRQSLSEKYGNVKEDTGNFHRRSRWEWQVTDPRSGDRATVSVFLNFDWWHEEEYIVRYTFALHRSEPAPDKSF